MNRLEKSYMREENFVELTLWSCEFDLKRQRFSILVLKFSLENAWKVLKFYFE